jgi:hypothetical protein
MIYFKDFIELEWTPEQGQKYLLDNLPDPFNTNLPMVDDIMDADRGWFHIGPGAIYMHYCGADDPRFSYFKFITDKLAIKPKYAAFIKSEAGTGLIHIDIESRVAALNFPVYGEWKNSVVKFWDSKEGNYEVCEPWRPSTKHGGLFRATAWHQVINEHPGSRIVLSFHWDESYSFEYMCENLLKKDL